MTMRALFKCFLLLLAAAFLAGKTSAKPTPVQKKALAFGWDTIYVNPEDILAHADLFDKTPFDGVVMRIQDIPLSNGGRISGESLFSDDPWNRNDLAKYVRTFRDMRKHRSLRESFLSVLLQPSVRVSFADDAPWRRAAENFAAAAWLVKEGGMPGLLIDTEDYWHRYQFRYEESDGIDYDTAVRLARRRGQEMFGAVFREFPEIALLSLYFLHQTPNYITFNDSLDPAGRARTYGDLWLPFVNGIFDVVPVTARIIDGNEDSYFSQFQQKSGFVSYYYMHSDARALIEPENRAKFSQVFQSGAAVYLDMYSNPTGSTYFMHARGFGGRADRLVENSVCALRGTDEYVWFYGEKLAFVPWREVTKKRQNYHSWTNQTWEAALPGFHDAIRFTKDPFGEVRRRAAAAEANGVANSFNGTVETNGFDKGTKTAAATGLTPGAYYAFTGECRGKWAEVRTILTTGNDDNWLYGWEYPAVSRPDPAGWRRILGLVRMGPDTNGFRVYYGRRDAGDDKVNFRNFKALKLPLEP